MSVSGTPFDDALSKEIEARSVQAEDTREEIPRVFYIATILVFAFLLLPVAIVVLAGLNAGNFLTFPPHGLSFRWVQAFLTSPVFIGSFLWSFALAILAGLTSTVLGTMTSLVLTRYEFRGRGLLSALFLSPIMLPGLVIGLGLYIYYISAVPMLARSFWGLLIGHVIVTMPYVVRTVSASLYHFDLSLEEAARNLGASPLKAFLQVTLPIIQPGIMAGSIFAFVMSFGQFDVSLFLSQPAFTPLPLTMYEEMRFRYTPIVAAAGIFAIALVATSILLTSRLTDLKRFAGFD
jgi:putative spermidine/putrescine transport system permease protein